MVTIIKNAKIFNGTGLSETDEVAFENDTITDKAEGDTVIDGTGCTLLPGLIDSHIHLQCEYLVEMASCGITTALDMGSCSNELPQSVMHQDGLTDILSCYLPAFAPGSLLIAKMGLPEKTEIRSAGDAARHVKEQVGYGAYYIKIIIEEQGINGGVAFPPELLGALACEAHSHGKKVVAHVATPGAFISAVNTGIDVLTHIPFVMPLPAPVIMSMSNKNQVSVPTMIMMKETVESIKKINPHVPVNFDFVKQSVNALYTAGIKILAGTDSNAAPTAPTSIPYGVSMFDELMLFVESGMSPTEALRSATAEPANYWGLSDRGEIKPGKRADLLLVEGNPTENISNIRNTKGVWIKGIQVKR
jgi:Imidazolonepropionase and related amidohydrolases